MDPHQAMEKMEDQIGNVEKRIKKIEVDQKRLLEEALHKKRLGD